MNRRNFLKLIGGVGAVAIISSIPLPSQRIKDTAIGTDGNKYECAATYRGLENPIFKGQYVQWEGVVCHTS